MPISLIYHKKNDLDREGKNLPHLYLLLQDSVSSFIACHIYINAYNVANRFFITLKQRYQFQHPVIL